jgi:hypothetical protein
MAAMPAAVSGAAANASLAMAAAETVGVQLLYYILCFTAKQTVPPAEQVLLSICVVVN